MMHGEIPIPKNQIPAPVQAWLNEQTAKFERRSISFGSDLTRCAPTPRPIPQPAARNLNTKLDAILAKFDSTTTPTSRDIMTTHADSAALAAANTKLAALQQQIAEMKKRLPAEVPADQKASFSAAQASWEKVSEAFGDSQARRPLDGESLPDYNRHFMGKYKAHSKPWQNVDFYQVPDSVLDVAVNQIRADALQAAANPPIEPGKLVMRQRRDAAGRVINEFHGDNGVMLDLSRNPRRFVTGFPALGQR